MKKMLSKKIGNYTFELEENTNRIMVYEEGKGVEPISFIRVSEGITEKGFDYEIMDFVSKR